MCVALGPSVVCTILRDMCISGAPRPMSPTKARTSFIKSGYRNVSCMFGTAKACHRHSRIKTFPNPVALPQSQVEGTSMNTTKRKKCYNRKIAMPQTIQLEQERLCEQRATPRSPSKPPWEREDSRKARLYTMRKHRLGVVSTTCITSGLPQEYFWDAQCVNALRLNNTFTRALKQGCGVQAMCSREGRNNYIRYMEEENCMATWPEKGKT